MSTPKVKVDVGLYNVYIGRFIPSSGMEINYFPWYQHNKYKRLSLIGYVSYGLEVGILSISSIKYKYKALSSRFGTGVELDVKLYRNLYFKSNAAAHIWTYEVPPQVFGQFYLTYKK